MGLDPLIEEVAYQKYSEYIHKEAQKKGLKDYKVIPWDSLSFDAQKSLVEYFGDK